MVAKLLLIRHAETDAGCRGLFVGKTDVDADPAGLAKLDRLQPVLNGFSPELWFSSPLKRAIQTVERICPLGEEGHGYQLDERLREIDFGRWEMKGFAEIADDDPGLVERWNEYDSFGFPEGESVGDFQMRIAAVFAFLRDLPVPEVAVVTHGGVVRAMICLALGLPPRNYLLFDVRPGTLTVLDLFSEGAVLTAMGV